MSAATDKNGLVRDGGYLIVFNPVTFLGTDRSSRRKEQVRYNKAIVLRVLSRWNSTHEKAVFDLPTTTSTAFRSLDAGTPTATAAGCIPARSYTGANGVKFDLTGVENTSDMWDVDYTYYERLFHIHAKTIPGFLRIGVDMPTGMTQARFQRNKKILGVGQAFGWRYCNLETVAFPEIDFSWQFGNETNVEIRGGVEFTYGEYIVGVPNDPDVIFRCLAGKEPQAHRVTMPVTVYDGEVESGLTRTYGFDGFRVYSQRDYEAAISEYRNVLDSDVLPQVVV